MQVCESEGVLRERRRESMRAAILRAAERRFAEHGFHDTTVEALAAAADVSVGSLYNHFGGKRGLFLAVVEQALQVNREYMATAYGAGRSALEQLQAAGEAYLRFHLDHPGYFRIVALPQTGGSDDDLGDLRERIAATVEAEVGKVIEVIRQGVDSGEFRPVDPVRAGTFLWGAWNGVIALGIRPDRLRLSDEEIAAVLATGRSIAIDALAKASATT